MIKFCIEISGLPSGEALLTPERPVFVRDFYATTGIRKFFTEASRKLTERPALHRPGANIIACRDVSVRLTGDENAAKEFSLLGLPSARRVAGQINSTSSPYFATVRMILPNAAP